MKSCTISPASFQALRVYRRVHKPDSQEPPNWMKSFSWTDFYIILCILDRKPIRSHHCHVLKKLNLFSFDHLIKSANIKLIFKSLNNQAPQGLSGLLVPFWVSGSVTRGVFAANSKEPFSTPSLGQMASVWGIKMWNSLPTEVKLDHDWDHFRLKLKQFLKRDQCLVL